MKTNISIPELDFEYKLWKNRLDYFENELHVYRARLLSVKLDAGSIAGQYIKPLKELIINIHTLKKEIQLHEEEMAHFKKDYPIDHQHDHYRDFVDIRTKIGDFTTRYNEIIKEIDGNVSDYLYV
jgi:hypothetical protein